MAGGEGGLSSVMVTGARSALETTLVLQSVSVALVQSLGPVALGQNSAVLVESSSLQV